MAFASFAELLTAAEQHGSLGAAVAAREAAETEQSLAEVRAQMAAALAVMREAVERGLSGEARSRSGLVGGDAALVAASQRGPLGGSFAVALAGALATGEVNAAMGRIVAAPTAGAAGVLPGVLFSIAGELGASEDAQVDALFAAGGVGSVIASRATLAGAAAGCQAEVGSAAAMAAAAAVELAGGSPAEAGNAAALALQGQLGLVCDPIGGLVEVPCVYRTATGAAVALAAAEMALAGVHFPVPFDEVVDAMAAIGRMMPAALRETALGGLAATPTGRHLGEAAGLSSGT